MSKTITTTVTMGLDFALLRKQKRILLKAADGKPLTQNQRDEIEGILGIFDAIQDNAVDNEGHSDREIFGRNFGKC